MAWTANIIEKSIDNGRLNVVVRFTDGTDIASEVITLQNGNVNELKARVQSKLDAINANVALNSTLVIGPIDPVVPDTTTPAERDRDAWFQKYNRYTSIKKNMIDTGILTGNEQPIVDLLAVVKAGFKPGYINFM